MIRFKCRMCEKQLKAPAGSGGRSGKCPRCGTRFHVPSGKPPPVVAEVDEPVQATLVDESAAKWLEEGDVVPPVIEADLADEQQDRFTPSDQMLIDEFLDRSITPQQHQQINEMAERLSPTPTVKRPGFLEEGSLSHTLGMLGGFIGGIAGLWLAFTWSWGYAAAEYDGFAFWFHFAVFFMVWEFLNTFWCIPIGVVAGVVIGGILDGLGIN